MVRKQVYITPQQDADLKRRARELAVTESELIRQGIEQITSADRDDAGGRGRWEDALEFFRCRAEIPVLPETKPWKWNREEICEERINRYPRLRG